MARDYDEPREHLIRRVETLEKHLAVADEKLNELADSFAAFRERVAQELGL